MLNELKKKNSACRANQITHLIKALLSIRGLWVVNSTRKILKNQEVKTEFRLLQKKYYRAFFVFLKRTEAMGINAQCQLRKKNHWSTVSAVQRQRFYCSIISDMCASTAFEDTSFSVDRKKKSRDAHSYEDTNLRSEKNTAFITSKWWNCRIQRQKISW